MIRPDPAWPQSMLARRIIAAALLGVAGGLLLAERKPPERIRITEAEEAERPRATPQGLSPEPPQNTAGLPSAPAGSRPAMSLEDVEIPPPPNCDHAKALWSCANPFPR